MWAKREAGLDDQFEWLSLRSRQKLANALANTLESAKKPL
jgi:hypothetical protein